MAGDYRHKYKFEWHWRMTTNDRYLPSGRLYISEQSGVAHRGRPSGPGGRPVSTVRVGVRTAQQSPAPTERPGEWEARGRALHTACRFTGNQNRASPGNLTGSCPTTGATLHSGAILNNRPTGAIRRRTRECRRIDSLDCPTNADFEDSPTGTASVARAHREHGTRTWRPLPA